MTSASSIKVSFVTLKPLGTPINKKDCLGYLLKCPGNYSGLIYCTTLLYSLAHNQYWSYILHPGNYSGN